MKLCNKCGEINDNEVNVCIKCGARTFTDVPDAVCTVCGKKVRTESQFCSNCGASMVSFAKIKAEAESPDGKASVAYDVVCPSCKAHLRAGTTTCDFCGQPIPVESLIQQEPAKDGSWDSDAVSLKQSLSELYDRKNERIIDTRETVFCPNCHSELAITTAFCPHCGTAVTQAVDHKVVIRKICSQCGTPNALTTPYCSYCFSSLADTEEQEFQLSFEDVLLSKGTVKRAVYQSNQSKKLLVCGNCGTLNNTDAEFCVKCGLKLAIEEPKNYCPACGAENDSDAVFCTICQFSFDGATPTAVEGRWLCECGQVNEKGDSYCYHCGKAKQPENGGNE